MIFKNTDQLTKTTNLFGKHTVDMLSKVHEDALWILENLGVGCKQKDIQQCFEKYSEQGDAIVYENRIYITQPLVEKCLSSVPGLSEFFVKQNSFFIGGTAPYIYDDKSKIGGIMPTSEHAEKISQIAQENEIIAGMGRGIKLKDEASQIDIIDRICKKPVYFAITTDKALEKAVEIYKNRKNIMIVFCLTRPPLEVNENFSDYFVKVVQAGLPVFISSMPMAGISAPYCYNGVLAMTHAEVLFGICAAQLLNKGVTCIHAGFPTIADVNIEYNPNYGLISHHVLNLLMTHLNLMLDLPTCQSAATTHEEHVTERALNDAKIGQALCKKYGFHMIRHPFAFLRYLIDFSFEKLEKCISIAENVKASDAPEITIPEYDVRGMESIKRIRLGVYMDDSLTTLNLGKIFNN